MALQINVLDYLEYSATRFPNKPSFCDENRAITFKELMQDAKAVGSYLAVRFGHTVRRPVAVLVDRTAISI
ncbi:MAG: D-alanine--poly(phosphoribitol) ligase, partial [Syntrophomonadaceae bacterium]|nr:D-alanine--poly(phosphoribitol) ligase [Syntrophomonadaceae bacterium]